MAEEMCIRDRDKSIHTIDATQPLEAVMDAIRTTVTNWVKELDA